VYASEGADTYGLYGNSTLSYAAYGNGLTFDMSLGAVSGKLLGNVDNFTVTPTGATVTPENIIGTAFADTFLADPVTLITSIDGGAGNDTLDFSAFTTGATVDFGTHSASGVGSFASIESFVGSAGNDVFTVGTAAGSETVNGGLGVNEIDLGFARAEYVINDNGDGTSLLSHIGATTQNITFSNIQSLVFTDATVSLIKAAQDDFFGVGHSGSFWRAADGDVWIWNNNGTGVDAYTHAAGQVDPVWSVVGVGDLGGDGKADVVFQNTTTGEIYLWNMNGGVIASQGDIIDGVSGNVVNLDASLWKGLGVRDFDGDGHADILWEGVGTNAGAVYEWSMNGNSIISQGAVANSPGSTYSVLGFGEVNGDGKSDVVWYDAAAGAVEFWYMNGSSRTVKDISVNPTLQLDGVGDFNGDGIADLVGHNTAGDYEIVTMGKNASTGVGTGSVASVDFVTNIASVWTVKQVNDYNGDGKADILFTSTTGDVWVWEMSGHSIIGQGSAGHIDVAANWSVIA
jgi:hypothetical protein